ncbi:MAG: hypothetical protein NTU95_10960 [Methanothrix sp.]|nr:hypothetical protein [Methanothrix sp.]
MAFVSTSVSSLDITTDTEHLNSCGIATFTIDITNTGETPLDPVKAQDTLPAGMSYLSDNRDGLAQGQKITWYNIGRLEVGASTQIKLVTRIGPCTRGWLENFVTVTGTPPTGYNVMDNDTADLFVTAPAKKRSVNEDSLVVGDQSASALYSASAINKRRIRSQQK